jgi:DNA-binding XRE family transcriptional regulator
MLQIAITCRQSPESALRRAFDCSPGCARFMEQAVLGRARTSAELGRLVREVRRERGLQQAELAELVQVSRMTISRLERGGDVAVGTVLRALSECGYALAVAPKFVKLRAEEP